MKFRFGSIAKTLTILAVTVACSSPGHGAIVAKWSFDEGTGTTAHDGMGNYHGALSPTGATFVAGGVSGGAIQLSRPLNGFVTMGNVLDLASGDFSLVAWIKTPPGDQTADSIVLGKHAAFYRNGYFIHINQSTGLPFSTVNKAFFYHGGSGFAAITAAETPLSSSVINDGNWHQIVAVYRANSIKSIYVDGAPAESSKPSQTPTGNAVAFLIGGVNEHGTPVGRLNGAVDEVQIYNHALSDADIQHLYENPTATVPDCEQQAALLAGQLAEARATIAALQDQLAASQEELLSTGQSIEQVNQHFRSIFRDPHFQVFGDTADAVGNLVEAIKNSNLGIKQNLYQRLKAQPAAP